MRSIPKSGEWYQALMQPDVPNASCCGEADAYWADEVHVRDGKTYVTITDDRPDEPRGRPHVDIGTEIEIPNNKLKWDKSNPTGHGIVFLSRNRLRILLRPARRRLIDRALRAQPQMLTQGSPRLFQKSQQSLTSFGVQFLGVQRPIMIRIRGTETLLDHREIFVLGEGPIMIGISSGQLLRRQSAGQLPFVESAVMVAF